MNNPIFDLEQQLLECWKVTDEINLVTQHFIDSPDWDDSHFSPKACDAMMNKYFAIKELYELKFQQLWDTFEDVCKEYHHRSKLAQMDREDWSFDDLTMDQEVLKDES